MQTPRFFIQSNLMLGLMRIENSNILSHIRALRLRIGDNLSLFNGQNNQEFHANLQQLDRDYITVEIINQNTISRELNTNIHLIQAMIAPNKMELIIEKATELGIKNIYMMPSNFSNYNFKSEAAQKRINRLNNIVISACEQCGRNVLPQIFNFENWTNGINFIQNLPRNALKIVLLPHAKNKISTLNNIIKENKYTDIYYIIGCEGGFTTPEEQELLQANCYSVSLNSSILRAETASIAMLSYLALSLY